jgi:cysteine-rich repeat protein
MDCTLRCGNGVVDTGEVCDDGNQNNGDSCLNSCMPSSCGDGFVDMTREQCDLGMNNSDQANAVCRTNCLLKRCGDGVLDQGEECDDGNVNGGDNCSAQCTIISYPCGASCPEMEMILIQAGVFNMGSNAYSTERPIHQVQIINNFYVGKTEVTVGQYRACVNAGSCTEPNGIVTSIYCNWTSSAGSKETHPVS